MKQTNCILTNRDIELRLREAGLQATAQRIAICRYVLCEAKHPTAEQVKDWVDKTFPKMSLATVYNTMNALVRCGLIRELALPHTSCTVYDNNMSLHHHFVDENTGAIIDLSPDEVQVELKLKKSLNIREIQVILKGGAA